MYKHFMAEIVRASFCFPHSIIVFMLTDSCLSSYFKRREKIVNSFDVVRIRKGLESLPSLTSLGNFFVERLFNNL